jgi:hypothetical protein
MGKLNEAPVQLAQEESPMSYDDLNNVEDTSAPPNPPSYGAKNGRTSFRAYNLIDQKEGRAINDTPPPPFLATEYPELARTYKQNEIPKFLLKGGGCRYNRRS